MPTTGHAKNAANFETVTIILANLGASYNPSQPLILLPALQTKVSAARAALDAVDAAEAAKKVSASERFTDFAALEKLAVSVRRTAEVEVNDEAFTASILAILRKMRGERAGDAPVDDPATPDIDESLAAHSVSARGYDNLVAYFADLIALLKTQAAYNPNEPELKIPALEARLAAAEAKNNAAKAAIAALGTALDTRDRILYDEATGIIKLVKLIKAQLARQPGTDSQPYRQITALTFRKF